MDKLRWHPDECESEDAAFSVNTSLSPSMIYGKGMELFRPSANYWHYQISSYTVNNNVPNAQHHPCAVMTPSSSQNFGHKYRSPSDDGQTHPYAHRVHLHRGILRYRYHTRTSPPSDLRHSCVGHEQRCCRTCGCRYRTRSCNTC